MTFYFNKQSLNSSCPEQLTSELYILTLNAAIYPMQFSVFHMVATILLYQKFWFAVENQRH
jgi:hypothetical protein